MVSAGLALALGSSLLELCECSVSGLGLVVVGGWARVGMGGAGRGACLARARPPDAWGTLAGACWRRPGLEPELGFRNDLNFKIL